MNGSPVIISFFVTVVHIKANTSTRSHYGQNFQSPALPEGGADRFSDHWDTAGQTLKIIYKGLRELEAVPPASPAEPPVEPLGEEPAIETAEAEEPTTGEPAVEALVAEEQWWDDLLSGIPSGEALSNMVERFDPQGFDLDLSVHDWMDIDLSAGQVMKRSKISGDGGNGYVARMGGDIGGHVTPLSWLS